MAFTLADHRKLLDSREFRGGGSEKFWEIIRDDDFYTVTSGRIGPAGKSQAKTLDDEEEAREVVAKLIAEKRAKGYVEVGGVPARRGERLGPDRNLGEGPREYPGLAPPLE